MGESSLKSRSGGLTIAVISINNHLSELKVFAGDRLFFGQNKERSW